MRLFGALVLDIALAQKCTPEYAAQQRCWDDCDLSWRQCLSDFFCQSEWEPDSGRCTTEQKNYCFGIFQTCKYECPCGNYSNSGVERTDSRSTCLNGCPCSDTANKKEYCDVKTDEILVMKAAEIRYLEYQIQMNPDTTQHLYTFTPFKEAPNEWPFFNISYGCSFTLMGRMFLVGGEDFNCQAYGCGYRNYEVFKSDDGVSLYQLQNLPINFASGSCAAYTDADAMICSSSHYKGTSNYGRECYHFDGRTYRPAGFTEDNHHRGKLVAFSRYDRDGDGLWNIGGGDYEHGAFYFEQFNNDLSSPDWRIVTSSKYDWLVGLYGFTAVSVTYEHYLGRPNSQQMFIFGGWNEIIDQPSHATYYLNGQGQVLKHPQHFLSQLRAYHTTIVKDNLIYHIGGDNVGGQGPDTVEIWEMRWHYDPAFERGQGWCPDWCFWGINPTPGGVCSSNVVGTSSCTYHYDTPQFNRRFVNPDRSASGFFATKNPIAYLV